MKTGYLLLSLILILVIYSYWYVKNTEKTKDEIKDFSLNVQKEQPINMIEDQPIGFGYKCIWFAVKTTDKERVSKIIGLKKQMPSNWEYGIKRAYENSIFISPEIQGWTFVVGWGLPDGSSTSSMSEVTTLLNALSKEFGEAQFYVSHRVVEYHGWIKSWEGQIVRSYFYLGEQVKNIEIFGEATEVEKGYKLVNTFSKEAQHDSYWDREDLTYPDEELVMRIADSWSIDPSKLEEYKGSNGLGILGVRQR